MSANVQRDPGLQKGVGIFFLAVICPRKKDCQFSHGIFRHSSVSGFRHFTGALAVLLEHAHNKKHFMKTLSGIKWKLRSLTSH